MHGDALPLARATAVVYCDDRSATPFSLSVHFIEWSEWLPKHLHVFISKDRWEAWLGDNVTELAQFINSLKWGDRIIEIYCI